MIKYLTQIIKKGSILSIGQFIQGSISILLLPLYTRVLTKAEIGTIDMLIVFQSIMTLLILVGMRQGFTRAYLLKDEDGADDNQEHKNSILSTVLIFLLFWGCFVLFFVFNVSSFISTLLFQSDQYSYLIFFAVVTALGTSLCQIYEAFFLNNGKVKTFVLITTVQLLLNFLLIIVMVVKFEKGVYGIVFSNSLTSLIFGLLLALFFFMKFGFSFNFKYLKKMLRFGIPIMVGILILVLFDIIDRFFVHYYLGLSELGTYSIARKISKIQSMAFVGPFLGVWTPTMYKIISKKNHKKILSDLLPIVTYIFCLITIAISSQSNELIIVFATEEYLEASNIIFWLCISQTLFVINTILSSGMHIVGKSEYGILVNGIVIILGIIFNILLIPLFGMFGAAVGTFLTFIFQSLVFYIVFQRLYYIPFKINLSFCIFILSFLAYFFIQQLQFIFSNFIILLIFKIIVIIIYALIGAWILLKSKLSIGDISKLELDNDRDD